MPTAQPVYLRGVPAGRLVPSVPAPWYRYGKRRLQRAPRQPGPADRAPAVRANGGAETLRGWWAGIERITGPEITDPYRLMNGHRL